MDSISAEYCVDLAAAGSAKSEPVVSVRGLVKRYSSHEAPGMGFPFVVYAIWRAAAQRRPFCCPECGSAVQAR